MIGEFFNKAVEESEKSVTEVFDRFKPGDMHTAASEHKPALKI